MKKKEYLQEKHRINTLERDSKKWETIEKSQQVVEEKRKYHAEVLKAGKRNLNGIPMNPVTLQYEESQEGKKLQARDEEAQVNFLWKK